MKSSSFIISSQLVPINVTGLGFDRDSSVRCSLVHSQSVLQRRRKLRRRRTVAGLPRTLHHNADSDESPGSRERTVIVHVGPGAASSSQDLGTRDSGCQTDDFLVSLAPSRRRIRAQRGFSLSMSRSAGNILVLQDAADAANMFSSSVGSHLRTRSLPRDGRMDNGHSEEDDEEEAELSPFDAEDFLPGPGALKDGDGVDRVLSQRQLSESPERSWLSRTRTQLPSCEISSSSDTFSSPVHSGSAAGVPLDHKEDHQSSSGNWSGSSSTCPSQTSETLPPAASPPLTGSSHCDSELSLNAANDNNPLDHYHHGLRTQRAGSFSSTAMDILEEAGDGLPVEGDWAYAAPRRQDLSPEPSREAESSLGCPSYTSMATCESSFSDKPPSEKADTVSHYSVDTEGYYTSMHFDCGIKGSKSFSYGYGSECDLSAHMSLGRRSLSLRKPKAKPSPPKRSSSLRKICSEGNIPEEPKTNQRPPTGKDRKLQLVLTDPPESVWGVEGSADLPDLGVFSSTDAHSFKDEGVVQSDYADLWLLNDLKSSDPYRSLSNSSTATGTTVIECIKSQESSESQTSQSGSGATTPSLPSGEGDFKLASPEKLAGLASPSSGYSSQSETPTSSFPGAFFPGPMSPASGKRKPKVPERKSSLSSLSRRDLELPVIPPSHLDLSSLYGVANRIQILNQNKQKPPPLAKPPPPPSWEAFKARPMAITPMVLHSVQLRSFSHEDKTTSKCPNVDPVDQESPHQIHGSSKGSVESEFTSDEELADEEAERRSETRNSPERDAPDSPDRNSGLESAEISGDSEVLQELKEEEEPGSPPRVPPPDGQSEAPQESPISDDGSKEAESPGGSSAHDGKGEESEDSFSKDSPPAENPEESRPEDEVFLSPTKTRTTEDLFAMIHRSKRKVLGRKDSSELNSRNRLSGASALSPPSSAGTSPVSMATPPLPTPPSSTAAVTPPPPQGPHRVPGPIYRNAKKSSTSNEEFKLLLLRKGSRSESSYRMSATEILKSPGTPKSTADPLTDPPRPNEDSPIQPGPEVSSPYPRADYYSPKSYGQSAGARPSRSRIPPPSSSSRYGARGRVYSVPMQAISEGETENSDGSPHDDRSSQSSVEERREI